MKKKPPLEYWEWVDPTSHTNGWIELSEYHDKSPCLCKSVGWVVYESRGKQGNITMVSHLGTDEKGNPVEGGGDLNIPKSVLRKRTRIDI